MLDVALVAVFGFEKAAIFGRILATHFAEFIFGNLAELVVGLLTGGRSATVRRSDGFTELCRRGHCVEGRLETVDADGLAEVYEVFLLVGSEAVFLDGGLDGGSNLRESQRILVFLELFHLCGGKVQLADFCKYGGLVSRFRANPV